MKAKEVVCFGHEPHLHLVIGQVLHTSARITELKKAGVAFLELDRISPPQGQLLALYPAKTLRLLGK
jgi:phosphohistidine phosphatase SixA